MTSVLVLGSGGREHALALAMSKDATVHVAPGNPGTAQCATNHPVDIMDGEAVAELAENLGVDLVVIGPEAPLVAGVADVVRDHGIACFGPSAAAAALEGSKSFAKSVMTEGGVPTASSRTCRSDDELNSALDQYGSPYVVKLDGLAGGKGVVVTTNRDEAFSHGKGAGEVVVEEYLDGPEVSLFVITDGEAALPLQPAQDFKRAYDQNRGPNTGGMGAYSPLPWLEEGFVDEVMREIVTPTLAVMRDRGTPFTGLLYVGLALTTSGPKVVEFNARFGDPETQVILPLLANSLTDVLLAAANGTLAGHELSFSPNAACCVVMAAEGYPASPAVGGAISLPLDDDEAHIIHAGTARDASGALVSSGGRVLSVVGHGSDVAKARSRAYARVDKVDFPSGFCRRDIAAEVK